MVKPYKHLLDNVDISKFDDSFFEKIKKRLYERSSITKNDCWFPYSSTNSVIIDGIAGTFTKWICVYKYKKQKYQKNGVQLDRVGCNKANRKCINPDHVFYAPFEKIKDNKTMPSGVLYNKLIHDFDMNQIDQAYSWFKKQFRIDSNNCWNRDVKNMHGNMIYNLCTGTAGQWCTLFKYKRVLRVQNRLTRIVCNNDKCFNPDHVVCLRLENAGSVAVLGKSSSYNEQALTYQDHQKAIDQVEHGETSNLDMANPVIISIEKNEPDIPLLQYNDSKLAEKVKMLSGMASKILDDLDKCSDDIRNLEKFLEESVPNQPYYYEIALNIETRGTLYRVIAFSWSNDNDKMRLQVHYHLKDLVEIQPLIQMPSQVRLKCGPHLPAFCDYIIENY